MKRAWAWLLQRLQDRCTHEGQHVSADLLEGGGGQTAIAWCRVCGAVQWKQMQGATVFYRGPWRRPQPLWWIR